MASLWDLFGQQDPLDPYIGAYGPRSFTGPARGSPGGLPFQAREVSPLVLTRERLQRELEDKPFLLPRFDANTTAEVGGTDPEKRRWYQALTLDRAAQTGKPLEDVVNASNYYPGSTTLKTATTGQGVDPSLWEGANPANYATGNASFDPKTGRWVGFAGGPQTTTFGSGRGMELGGIEGQAGLPYARAVGYTGPSTTPIGPAGPQGTGSAPPLEGGDAYASAQPGKERKMPASLWDQLSSGDIAGAFTPRDASGQPTSFGDAIAQNRQSLIGLGMGLLQPRSLAVGAPATSAWGNALQGYQQGASADAANIYRQAQLQHLKTQEARQAAQDAFNRQMAEKQFTQSTLTPYQKAQADITAAKGTPQEQSVTDFYRHQFEVEPPKTREVFDRTLGRNVVQEFNPRNKQWEIAREGGGATAPAPAFDPFTAGTGRPVYGQGAGGYSTPAPATAVAPAAGPQPLEPARKPLTAHEQTAIDEADKSVLANRQVLGTLQDAKRLSSNAFSGLFPMQRAMVGAQFPENLPPGTSAQPAKDTLLLNNAVIGQAVEQLKATFGGNPSEGERKILLDLAGSMNAPDSVRQKIYDNAIKLANARLELNQRRAQEIRSGTYYGPGDSKPAPSIGGAAAGATQRQTIGGKGYSKIGGQWYED